MRVIAGKARSLPLKTVPGMDTRPTTDRIKETLFNMLQPYLADCHFLDLFAGSGAIGIEALSRGAALCVFVEQNKKASACIKDNLRFTRLEENARVMTTDVITAIRQLESGGVFDCIFMDPPYEKEWEKQVLAACRYASFVTEDTLFVIEASLHTSFSYLDDLGYEIIKDKKYKTNRHVFVRIKGKEQTS
ncbi:MAG: 16S rRNA (guanine(966)-N(2))-methyltransferase RsmD [Lachnospiraceae bacterium]|jgi:16S rRNA (guanine966-N2)-methyltransferase